MKKNTEWRYERAPGVGLYIQNIADDGYIPNYVGLSDKAVGFKYGVFVVRPGRLSRDRTPGAGQMANIDMKLRNSHNKDYQVEVYEERIHIEKELSENCFLFEDNDLVRVWTTVKDDYPQLISIISELIEEAAQAVYKDEDDGVPKIDKTAILKLKKVHDYAYGGKIYFDLNEMYFDVVNHILPEQLSVGVIDAMKVYKPNEDNELICCVDMKKNALIFYTEGKKPFYVFPCELLKHCIKWCSGLKLVERQEATHWLSDAVKASDEKGAFQSVDSICVIGETNFGDGDMDVIFEK
jgi:hypothetical protein